MEIRKALPEGLPVVGDSTRRTIAAVYPHDYPTGIEEAPKGGIQN